MAEAALRTENLSRSFGGLAAVSGVSLECRSGEVHAVIGPNGAGKTTLINMLSGDLAPSAGRIELFGEDVDRPAAGARLAARRRPQLPEDQHLPRRSACSRTAASRRSRACRARCGCCAASSATAR